MQGIILSVLWRIWIINKLNCLNQNNENTRNNSKIELFGSQIIKEKQAKNQYHI